MVLELVEVDGRLDHFRVHFELGNVVVERVRVHVVQERSGLWVLLFDLVEALDDARQHLHGLVDTDDLLEPRTAAVEALADAVQVGHLAQVFVLQDFARNVVSDKHLHDILPLQDLVAVD